MDRREFIRTGCTACLSMAVISTLGLGCEATKYITGSLTNDGIIINKNDFAIKQKGGLAYSSFIIVRNDALQYPVCVFRFNEEEYSALWMRCTHQGTELQASGDVLQCTAHGSEFSNKGVVITGPATAALRNFPVTINNNEIFIDLRKKS